jgi:hypothetical protein
MTTAKDTDHSRSKSRQDITRLNTLRILDCRHAISSVFTVSRYESETQRGELVFDAITGLLVLSEPFGERGRLGGDCFKSGVQGVNELDGG